MRENRSVQVIIMEYTEGNLDNQERLPSIFQRFSEEWQLRVECQVKYQLQRQTEKWRLLLEKEIFNKR